MDGKPKLSIWVGCRQILPVPQFNQRQSEKAVVTVNTVGIDKRLGALNYLEGLDAQQDCECLNPWT